MVKIICDTKEFDELLMDVLFQACGTTIDGVEVYDNSCLSAYEDACEGKL